MASDRQDDKQLEKMITAACRKAGVPKPLIPNMITVVQTILADQKFDPSSMTILAETHQMIADIVASFIKQCHEINNAITNIHEQTLARQTNWQETQQRFPSKLSRQLEEEAKQFEAQQKSAPTAGG